MLLCGENQLHTCQLRFCVDQKNEKDFWIKLA
jgi:hypothetical protein